MVDVVALPYTSLLSGSARAAVGIGLRGAVVVVDEAHNLAAAAAQANSATLGGTALLHACRQAEAYLARYRSRLRGRNVIECTRLVTLLRGLLGVAQRAAGGMPLGERAAKSAVVAARRAKAAAAAAASATGEAAAMPPPDGGAASEDGPGRAVDGSQSVGPVAAGRASGGGGGGAGMTPAVRSADERSPQGQWLLDPTQLWAAARAEHLPLQGLLSWSEQSGLSRKLRGFVDAASRKEAAEAARAPPAGGRRAVRAMGPASAMQSVVSFLDASLRGGGAGSKVLVTVDVAAARRAIDQARASPAVAAARSAAAGAARRPPRPSPTPWTGAPAAALAAVTIKLSVVSPAEAVRPLFEEPRAVLLAGGTMPPLPELRQQLFPRLPQGRLAAFACGHVVGGEALCGAVLRCGPAGRPIDMSVRGRAGPAGQASLRDLGDALARLAAVAPAGMVVFLPSYAVEAQLLGGGGLWERSGALAEARRHKRVFREPRAGADLDAVMRAYGEAALAPGGGALLFAVMGGKLSEGLNFKDGLARTVVVAGLPYPSANDPELRERMARMDAEHGAGAGRRLYEGICMQSVNQAIGRAVRHRGDWAATVLADARFEGAAVQGRLPSWLRPHVRSHATFGEAEAALARFFEARGATDRG